MASTSHLLGEVKTYFGSVGCNVGGRAWKAEVGFSKPLQVAELLHLFVKKIIGGLFPLGQHPKTPRIFGVAEHRILRRRTISRVCYQDPKTLTVSQTALG
jgi:hypothetical protein